MFRLMHRTLSFFLVALSGLCAGCAVAPPPAPSPPVLAVAATPVIAASSNCREFRQTVTIGGEAKEAWGTSCQQPDGTWKVSAASTPSPAPPPPSAPQIAAAPVAVYSYYPYAFPPPFYYPFYGYPEPFYGGWFVGARFR
jgi:hypothetical protein